jgi:hypothetical protein
MRFITGMIFLAGKIEAANLMAVDLEDRAFPFINLITTRFPDERARANRGG